MRYAHIRPAINDLSATGSTLYLLTSFIGSVWLLFDTWIGQHSVPGALGYDVTRLTSADYHTVVAAVVGGAIGGVINGLRSVLHYSRSFDSRHVWKYVAAPWMGSALSLLTYALLTTTASVLGGQPPPPAAADTLSIATPQLLSNFAVGALAGYGARDAFVWLDAQVHKLFAVEQAVPQVAGRPAKVAMSRIEAEELAVGAVASVPAAAMPGTVLDQEPAAGTRVSKGDSVDITVAAPRLPALAGLQAEAQA
jgi:hypothetical protein